VTYEYQCENPTCQHRWEAEQRIADEALRDCPACKKPTARRLISGGTGHILVGPRWSRDGYHG